jgi:hypothetical protein
MTNPPSPGKCDICDKEFKYLIPHRKRNHPDATPYLPRKKGDGKKGVTPTLPTEPKQRQLKIEKQPEVSRTHLYAIAGFVGLSALALILLRKK